MLPEYKRSWHGPEKPNNGLVYNSHRRCHRYNYMSVMGFNYYDIDKATSELLPNAQEDLASNFDVCDMIKGKRVPPKDAMRSLKRRLLHRNPNVQMLAMKVRYNFGPLLFKWHLAYRRLL